MESEDSKGIKEHVNKTENSKPLILETKPHEDIPSPSPSSCSSILEFDIDEKGSLEAPSATSAPENATQTWSGSPDQSPPTQTMAHPPGYDPNRIPASVFSTNNADWSVTSNESLFSIHMGNNSFSRDHAIMFGKSGEFPRLDDWNSELSSLPPVMEVSTHEESSVRSRKASDIGSQDSDNNLNVAAHTGLDMENHGQPQMPVVVSNNTPHVRNVSNSRVSDGSGHSGSSFAFPVLLGDGGKGNGSLKVANETEKPELQAQVSKASSLNTSKASCCSNWFSWSCCPKCC